MFVKVLEGHKEYHSHDMEAGSDWISVALKIYMESP